MVGVEPAVVRVAEAIKGSDVDHGADLALPEDASSVSDVTFARRASNSLKVTPCALKSHSLAGEVKFPGMLMDILDHRCRPVGQPRCEARTRGDQTDTDLDATVRSDIDPRSAVSRRTVGTLLPDRPRR